MTCGEEACKHEWHRRKCTVMFIAVAGDIRENVLPVLEKTLNRLKKEAVKKQEKLVKQ
jgi:hypothetical protein